jgi:hypothetical protein
MKAEFLYVWGDALVSFEISTAPSFLIGNMDKPAPCEPFFVSWNDHGLAGAHL